MYTYSDIDKILNAQRALDLFLTGEWPLLFKSVFSDDSTPVHRSQFGKLTSLLSSLSARYIFCSHDDKAYKREPFATSAGFVCRFIGLKSCSKHNVNNYLRQLFMGLSLLPLTESSEAELKQNIHQAAPNPFKPFKSKIIESIDKGEDKSTLFISNLPLQIRQNQLVDFLLRWGPLSTIEYRRSYAFVKYKDQELHQKLIKQSGKHSLHGRSISFAYKTLKEEERIIQTDSCWFCYDNPQIERHLIVQKGAKHFYVACAKGPLTDYHLLLIPKVHISSSFEFLEDLKLEYISMKKAILQFFSSKELDFLAFQVFLPRKDRAHTSHTFLSLIGFDRVNNFDDLFLEFLYSKKMKSKDPSSLTPEEIENFTKYGFFQCQFPGLRTASGQKTIERIHGASKGMPPDIGRRLIVQFLELPRQKMNWKKCIQTEEVEKAETDRISKEMKQFLTSKK